LKYQRMLEMDIRKAESQADVAAVRQLWREYWESFGLPMDFQGFGPELEGLPGAYGAQGGTLLLATYKDDPAGTIALRRLNRTSGEVKRLYLRPQFRGRGLGRRLLESVIERARALRYESLYADTLPVMTEALSFYERAGFERVAAYSDAPTPGAIYMKLELVNPRGQPPAEAL
jgi:putative acetyltransferase